MVRVGAEPERRAQLGHVLSVGSPRDGLPNPSLKATSTDLGWMSPGCNCPGCNFQLLPTAYRDAVLALRETERQLSVFLFSVWIQLFVQQAWLDVGIVLVLVALVFGDITIDLMIKNLAD